MPDSLDAAVAAAEEEVARMQAALDAAQARLAQARARIDEHRALLEKARRQRAMLRAKFQQQYETNPPRR